MKRILFLSAENIIRQNCSSLLLGNNIPQRFYYINLDKIFFEGDPVPPEYEERTVRIKRVGVAKYFQIISLLRRYDVIVTERNILTIFGFLSKYIYKKKWVADLQDCPYKETGNKHHKNIFGFFSSYLKSHLVYYIIRYADSIVVSFSLERFYKYYKGNKDKVRHFYNAVDVKEISGLKPSAIRKPNIQIVYFGADIYKYGIPEAHQYLKLYCAQNKIKIDLNLIGNIKGEYTSDDYLMVNISGQKDRRDLIPFLKSMDIGLVPFQRGTDIEHTYPIKSIEMFLCSKRLLLGDTPGMREMFGDHSSRIQYFFPERYDSFEKALTKIIMPGISDEPLNICESDINKFDAKIKNDRISDIYNS